MDSRPNAQFPYTLNIHIRVLPFTSSLRTILDRDLRESNTNSANVAAQDVAAVEGLARPNCIIQTFEVDWRYSVSYRYSH